jgi:hypothetical protein
MGGEVPQERSSNFWPRLTVSSAELQLLCAAEVSWAVSVWDISRKTVISSHCALTEKVAFFGREPKRRSDHKCR